MPWGTKNMPPKKNLSRGSLSNWCDVDADADANADADADADISNTMSTPTLRGVDITTSNKDPNTSKARCHKIRILDN